MHGIFSQDACRDNSITPMLNVTPFVLRNPQMTFMRFLAFFSKEQIKRLPAAISMLHNIATAINCRESHKKCAFIRIFSHKSNLT